MSLDERIESECRKLSRQDRALAREIARMEREKQSVANRIKHYARNGEIELLHPCASEYIIFKQNIVKLHKIKGQMSNVKQKIRLMKSVTEVNKAIQTLTATMKQMNSSMRLTNIQNMIMEFEVESSQNEILQESVEDMLNDEVDEFEQSELVSLVLDEIGIEKTDMKNAPSGQTNDIETLVRSLNMY